MASQLVAVAPMIAVAASLFAAVVNNGYCCCIAVVNCCTDGSCCCIAVGGCCTNGCCCIDAGNCTAAPTVAVVATANGPVVAWPVEAVVAVLAAAETSMWHLELLVSEGETDTCWSPCKGLPKIAKTATCASTASAKSRTSDHCTTLKCISSYVTLMH